MKVIEYAEKKLEELKEKYNFYEIMYWMAYLDGAHAQKEEDDDDN